MSEGETESKGARLPEAVEEEGGTAERPRALAGAGLRDEHSEWGRR